ncbi:MAG: phosphoglycerate mutase [Paenibacillaceae bacterium]|jgi:broad specificity phosphatase PhoE|nr:phosphoglycerate mutase [Paenibacillaceae bacterium]
MHLYVIRHGESLGNLRQTDEADCLLSRRGEQQALRVRDFFEQRPVGKIYSSPLKRTIMTAAPLAGAKGLPIVLAPGMAEFFSGAWPAYGRQQWDSCGTLVRKHQNTQFEEGDEPEAKWWPDWPEERSLATSRVKRFYAARLAPLLNTDEHIVVVGHGATTSDLIRLVCPDIKYPPLPSGTNAVICEFLLEDGGVYVYCRVHAEHLAGLD